MRICYVNDNALHFTMREMRAIFTNPRVWVIIAVVALVLGLAGPFGTYELPIGARLAYWGVTVILTFLAGDFVITLVSAALWRRLNKWALLPIAGLAGAVPVTLIVIGINMLAFGPRFAAIDLLPLFLYCLAITTAVTLVFYVIEPRGPDGELLVTGDRADNPKAPPLLERLPVHKRGTLIRLSVQDHYVEIETDRGRELVLMRLADAMKETDGSEGLQIHRSHWVALAGVREVRRVSGKVMVQTVSGGELPVSRTYLPGLKQAGLIR